jgi:hypothetical protein
MIHQLMNFALVKVKRWPSQAAAPRQIGGRRWPDRRCGMDRWGIGPTAFDFRDAEFADRLQQADTNPVKVGRFSAL